MKDSQARGALVGLATADALGAPFEFLTKNLPSPTATLEMKGGGIGWEAGEFTDDTEMALLLAENILSSQDDLIDEDSLVKAYSNWALSGPKDIGITCQNAIRGAESAHEARRRSLENHELSGGKSAGNGTIMRVTPIALAASSKEEAVKYARQEATLTHFDTAAAWCSAALTSALLHLDHPLEAVFQEVEGDERIQSALAVVGDETALRELNAQQTGTAWVTLAVALHALIYLDDYEKGVTWAISLGGDTDTNACVAGALLGARHSVDSIPTRWTQMLWERERIAEIASSLAARSQ